METLIPQERLKNFDVYRGALDKFIGFKDVDLVIDDSAETCYFSPKEKKVAIAGRWLTEKKGEDREFEELKIKFGIFHEFSHYRDMIKETEETGNESMIKILTEIGKRAIILKDGGKTIRIPLGSIIHTLYNSIDDIIVNTEVGNYIYSEITRDDMKSVYQRYLFADYKGDDKEEQSVVEIRDVLTSKETRTSELNIDEPVDYSELPGYRALPYYFLRRYMVRDQEIILPEQIKRVLFDDTGKSRVRTESYKKLIEIFEKKISESKKGNPRYNMLKDKLDEQLKLLENIAKTYPLRNVELKKALLDILADGTTVVTSRGKKIKGIDKNITGYLSLEDIIWLFTITQGKDKDHRLMVSPDKRYEIIHKFFEPILTTYILMDLLDHDIPEEDMESGGKDGESSDGENSNNGQGGGNGEGETGDEEQEGNEKGDQKGDKKGKNKDKSDGEQGRDDGKKGEQSDGEEDEDDQEISGSIGAKIRDLKKVIKYKQGEKTKEAIKRQSQKTGKTLSEILKEHGFSTEEADKAKESLDRVIKNFSEEIKEFTEMLKDELKKLEIEFEKEFFLSRKGNNVNYDAARKEIGRHLIDGDFEGSRMFDKKRFREAIQEEFKKLVFYFMLDVSGSTEKFRGDDGYLNGIAIALAAALHNVEQDIRDLIGDPNYTIPINFIVYANSAELIKCKYNSFDEMLAEANYKIISLSGGTDDADGWNKSAEKVIEDFDENETYAEDVEEDKMKAVVLQIADSDITEYGVQQFRSKIREKYGDKADAILRGIETKRLILGERYEAERFLSEEEVNRMEGEFKPTIIYDPNTHQPVRDEHGNIRVKINEIGVKRKSEISDNVRRLFENLFVETMKKK